MSESFVCRGSRAATIARRTGAVSVEIATAMRRAGSRAGVG
jgi:hypothetical protein